MAIQTPSLSVLICSLPNRLKNLASITGKIKGCEVIYLGDNKYMTVGEKRNWLLRIAHGKYVTFVDDDDFISDDYVKEIVEATKSDADVIVFDVACSVNGGKFKPVIYDIAYKRDKNLTDRYLRRPNHLMAVKREIALKTGFPEKSFGEDSEYSLRLKLKTQHRIDKTLYYYVFSNKTSETQ